MTKIEEMACRAYTEQAKRDAGKGTFPPWDALPLMFRFALKQTMRDALAVLREPTDDMKIAGGEAQTQSIGSYGEPAVVWWAMIDALLAEDPAR